MKMEKFFKVLNGELDINAFEQWLYATPEIEGLFSPDDYLELISINYQSRLAKYEFIRLLTRIINQGGFETYKLIKLLETIIAKSPDWYDALCQCDRLSPYGYYFLEDLESCAHSVSAESYRQFGPVNFEQLTDGQKNKLMETCYPHAAESAMKVLGWLKEGKIIITEEAKKGAPFNIHVFIDNRDKTGC